jgi:hypothetical protein
MKLAPSAVAVLCVLALAACGGGGSAPTVAATAGTGAGAGATTSAPASAAATASTAPASVAPSQGPTTSAICEPWLTTAKVVALTGRSVTNLDAYNYLNDGQPVDCEWTLADGSRLTLFVLVQPQYGTVSDYLGADGSLVGGVEYVPNLGKVAPYDTQSGMPTTLTWFPDDAIIFELMAEPGLPDQLITKDQLVALARAVTTAKLPPKP